MRRGRLSQHKYYKRDRQQGVKRIAMKWEDIAWEGARAIGEEDAQAWLDGMKDILSDPYFERDPIPLPAVVATRMRNKNPGVLGHVFVSPHPEAWHRLGYYQVWRPTSDEENYTVEDIFGESKVREVLLENHLKRAKL